MAEKPTKRRKVGRAEAQPEEHDQGLPSFKDLAADDLNDEDDDVENLAEPFDSKRLEGPSLAI